MLLLRKRGVLALLRPREKTSQYQSHSRPRGTPAQVEALHRILTAERDIEALDGQTWNDLFMDDVLAAVDRTTTPLGHQRLYHNLRAAPGVPPPSEDFTALVSQLRTDDTKRAHIMRALGRVATLDAYGLADFVFRKSVSPALTERLPPILFIVSCALLVSIPWWVGAAALLLPIALVSLTVRIVLYEKLATFVSMFRLVAPLHESGRAVRDILGLEGVGARDTWTRLNPLALLSRSLRWQNEQSEDWRRVASEYANVLLCWDGVVMSIARPILAKRRAELTELLDSVTNADTACAIAQLQNEFPDWCAPVWSTDPMIEVEGMRHPLIAGAVATSIEETAGRGLLLTGAHMGGKSTLLRTLATVVILAQGLGVTPARHYRAPRLRVMSALGHDDSIRERRSYHLTEADRHVELLHAATRASPCLFLVDEPLRGTNTLERVSASYAILHFLVTQGHFVVATTHDIELVRLLTAQFEVWQVGPDVLGNLRDHDYVLKRGTTFPKNALALLAERGAPNAVIALAQDIAAKLELRERAGL